MRATVVTTLLTKLRPLTPTLAPKNRGEGEVKQPALAKAAGSGIAPETACNLGAIGFNINTG